MTVIKNFKAVLAGKCHARRLLMISPIVLLTACGPNQPMLSDINLSGIGWLKGEPESKTITVTLPSDVKKLGQGNKIEMRIYNALELAKKKRFDDALELMAAVRVELETDSSGFQAVTGCMSVMALLAGDIHEFKRNARLLDKSLGEPIQVPEPFVEVISLYRAMVGKRMPVNTPEGIQRMNDQRALSITADLRKER